jgi:hypothetical protein
LKPLFCTSFEFFLICWSLLTYFMMMSVKSACKRRFLCHGRHGAVIDHARSLHVQQQQQEKQQRIFSSCYVAGAAGGARIGVSYLYSWGSGDTMLSISKATPRATITKRLFFASSTDHTTLLAQAEIHVLSVAAAAAAAVDESTTTTTTTTQQIVLAPTGMDVDTVRKVPQLHMARLLLTTTTTNNNSNEIVMTFHSAKVVNRSLGSTRHVCRRLLEYAMAMAHQQQEMTSSSRRNVKIFAKSTLQGLSEWVLNLLKKESGETIVVTDFVRSLSTRERQTVQAISNGDLTAFASEQKNHQEEENGNRTAVELWDQLARLYLHDCSGSSAACEAGLYQSLVGCRLVSIEQQADMTDYSNMSGGAMAVFQLS